MSSTRLEYFISSQESVSSGWRYVYSFGGIVMHCIGDSHAGRVCDQKARLSSQVVVVRWVKAKRCPPKCGDSYLWWATARCTLWQAGGLDEGLLSLGEELLLTWIMRGEIRAVTLNESARFLGVGMIDSKDVVFGYYPNSARRKY